MKWGTLLFLWRSQDASGPREGQRPPVMSRCESQQRPFFKPMIADTGVY